MRGWDTRSDALFSYVSCEARVPKDHPLRPIQRITDEALAALSPEFEKLYARFGRPSIPPERLLRALLLQAFYSVRSQKQVVELDYNLLFRWFVGLSLDDEVWDETVGHIVGLIGTQRDPMAAGTVRHHFERGLALGRSGRQGQTRVDHQSMPVLDQNMPQIGELGGFEFVAILRAHNVAPHVAQNTTNRRSPIDGRTTRHPGYALSGRLRGRIEEVFGRLSQDPSPWSGPRRLDVHPDGHGLQSRPADEAGSGGGVATLAICPETAKTGKFEK